MVRNDAQHSPDEWKYTPDTDGDGNVAANYTAADAVLDTLGITSDDINEAYIGYTYHVLYAAYIGIMYGVLTTLTSDIPARIIVLPVIAGTATITGYYLATQNARRTLGITAATVLTVTVTYLTTTGVIAA